MSSLVLAGTQIAQSILGAVRAPRDCPASMNSQEIADLLGSRHDNVKRCITRLVAAGAIQCPPLEVIKNHQCRDMSVYTFTGPQGELDSVTVVAQLSPTFTAALVKRWRELELMQARPMSASEALQIALEIENQRLELASRLDESERTAEMLRSHFTEGMTIPAFCRCLNGVNVQKVCKFLELKGWLYRRDPELNNWLVRARVRDRLLTEELKVYETGKKSRAVLQRPVLLREGAIKLFEMYRAGELPMKATWDGRYEHAKQA